MKIYDMDTVLNFGKHKGKIIKQLFNENEENYIFWLYYKNICEFSENVKNELNFIENENNLIINDFKYII